MDAWVQGLLADPAVRNQPEPKTIELIAHRKPLLFLSGFGRTALQLEDFSYLLELGGCDKGTEVMRKIILGLFDPSKDGRTPQENVAVGSEGTAPRAS